MPFDFKDLMTFSPAPPFGLTLSFSNSEGFNKQCIQMESLLSTSLLPLKLTHNVAKTNSCHNPRSAQENSVKNTVRNILVTHSFSPISSARRGGSDVMVCVFRQPQGMMIIRLSWECVQYAFSALGHNGARIG